MNEQEVKKLYQALLSKGYSTQDLGDEQRFLSKMGDANNRKQLYDWVSSKGNFRIGDFNAYEARLTGGAQQEQPSTSDTQDFTMKESELEGKQEKREAQKPQQPTVNIPSVADMMEEHKKRTAMPPVFQSEVGLDEEGNRVTRPKVENVHVPGTPSPQVSPVYRDFMGNEYDATDPNVQNEAESQVHTQQINLAKANRVQVADLSQIIDDALADAKGQSVEQYVKLAKEEPFMSTMMITAGAADPTDMQAQLRGAVHRSENIPTEEAFALSKRIKDLEAAQRAMRDAKRIINEADHNAKSGTFGKWLESSFAGGAVRGFGQKLFDVDTWDMGFSDAQDATALMSALNAFDKGEPLTDSQQALLDAKAVELATNAYFGSYVGRGYKAGNVTAESVPFMIEMCLNPASGTGHAAQNAMARYAIKRFGKKVVKDNAKKYLATKVATRVAGDIAGSSVMAATTGGLGVTADAINRMNGDVQYETNDEGLSVFAGHTEGDDFGEAFGKAFASRTIENYSEMMGEYFAPVLGWAGKGVRKGLGKVGLEGVNDFIENVAASDVARVVGDFEKNAKWNGVFGEYAEEVAGGIMNALVVGDQTLDADPETGVFNLDNNIDTFLGVSLMGGFMSGIKTAGYRTPKYRARQDMMAKDDAAASVFGNQDTWGEIRNTIAVGDDADAKRKLAEVLGNPDFTPEQRAAALDYAKAVQAYRGMLKGEEKRREEQDPTQTDLETSFDNGYSLESNQEMNDAKNMLDYQRQRIGEFATDDMLNQLDADPVGALNAIRVNEAWTDEEKQTATDYVNAKATYDGMIQHVQDDIESQINASNSLIDGRVHPDDGMIHPATMKTNDRKVYVIGGNLAMNDDGTMVDRENSDESIIVRDAETGSIEFTDPRDVLSTDETIDAAQEKQIAQEAIRQQYAQEAANKIDGVLPFNEGDQYMVVDEQGVQHTVAVTPQPVGQTDGNTTPLGEGEVMVSVDGTEPIPMSRATIQEMADNANLARLQQFEQEKAAQREAEAEAEREASRPVYNINDEITLQTDEGTVRGSITADANEDGLIEVYTERPIGGKKINLYNRDELDAMVVQHNGVAQEPAAEAEPQPTEQPSVEAEGEAADDAMPMIGEGDEAEPDFMNTTPERAHSYIYNEAGLSRDEANQFVEANKKAADKALEKAKNTKPKMGTSLAKYRKEQTEYQQNVDAAQKVADYWKKVKDAQQLVLSAEQEERAKQNEAVHEQAVIEEQTRQAEELRKREEQAALGTNNVAPAIREKWEAAPKVEGARNEIVLANGEHVPGRYVLVESGAATPSHNPRAEFVKNEGFPQDENGQSVNDRDYERDKDAQSTTRQIASIYDQRALQTPVVVTNDGIVLSGNGRTMAGELAAQDNTDGAYIEHLKQYGSQFGFAPEQVEGMQHPRVVFVPDEAMPYTADTFAKFNQQEMKGQNKTEQAVKLGKIVGDDTFSRIIRSINGYNTLGEYYADTQATTQAINELRDAGAISQAQYGEMFDGETISAQGREMLENMLIGKAFESNPDAVRQITAFKGVRQGVITALAEISNNIMLGDEYSHEADLAQAINLVYQARNAGYKAGEKVSNFARQLNLFPFDEGATVADADNATVLMFADLLNEGKPTLLKKALALYNQAAMDSANGQLDIFSGDVRSKEEILDEVRQLLKYGTEEQQQAALDAATAERVAASQPIVQEDGTTGTSNQDGETAGSTGVEAESPVAAAESPVAAAEREVNTNPTEAQKEAGNYKKGHVKIDGYDVTIENPKGSERSGTDASGKQWRQTMHNTYGYIRGTEGVDGDHIDVFLSDAPESGNVYVIDQRKADGSFDEHKVMYGFNSAEEARDAYLSNYEEGWQGLGAITGVTKEEFKKWVNSSHRKTKPFAEYKSVKPTEGQNEGVALKAEQTEQTVSDSVSDSVSDTNIDNQVQEFVDAYKKWGADVRDDALYNAYYEAKNRLHDTMRAMSDDELAAFNEKYGKQNAHVADEVRQEQGRRLNETRINKSFEDGLKAQGEITGTAKAPKLSMDKFTDKTEQRPVLNGIYHDESGYAVASDGKLLIADKTEYDEQNKGNVVITHKVGDKNKGDVIANAKYPAWKAIVNGIEGRNKAEVTWDGLRNFLAGVEETLKSRWKAEKESNGTKESFASWSESAIVAIRMPNGEVCVYNYGMLRAFADAASSMGMSEITYGAENPLKATNDNGVVMVMPVNPTSIAEEEFGHENEGRRLYYEWGGAEKAQTSKPAADAAGTVAKPAEEAAATTAEGTTAGKPAATRTRASKVGKIDDFGEKIGGARKDVARGRIRDTKKMTVKDLTTLKKGADDILSQTNIMRLYKDGQMDEQTARGFMALNNAAKVAMKHASPTGRELIMTKYRDAAVAWEEGKPVVFEVTDEDVKAYQSQFGVQVTDEKARESLDYLITDPYNMFMQTYEAIDYPAVERKLGQYVIMDYTSMKGRHWTPSRPYWVKNGLRAQRGYPFATMESAVAELKKLCPEVTEKEKKSRGEKAEHGLHVTKEGYGFYIKSRNIPGNIYLSPKFWTEKEAQKYLDDNLERLKEREQRLVDALMGSNIGMAEREGVDYRNGKDVTPQDFLDEFGFRGVEFGNWVPQGERQMYLNKTYDAIKDFCAIVGISPRAFSLGGRLGLAFGARGKSRAMAHYEPGKEVINLTRMSGVGSLAHEWFHALDNYLAKQKTGNMSDMATETHDVVREELGDVFKEMFNAMRALDYDKRSRRAGEYWGRTVEEFARLFENYIYNKLAAKETTSPVLVREDVLLDNIGEDLKNSWPYPSAEENAKMEPYFDKLFDTIQEKTDANGNVVLFQKVDGSTIAREADAAEEALRDEVIRLMREAGIEVSTDWEEGQRVLDAYRELVMLMGGGKKKTTSETAKAQSPEGEQAYITDISDADSGAKVIKNIEKLAKDYEKKSNQPRTFLEDVAEAIGAVGRGSKSKYLKFKAKNGRIVVLRLANHNASVRNFDNNNEEEGVSIVVSGTDNNGVENNGLAHLVEFFYQEKDLRKADGKPLVEIIRSIEQMLYSGEYKDTTGLAKEEEVNADIIREMRAYHGSGADFDAFDHSFIGTGEGNQTFGWGTYVSDVEGVGRGYAKRIGDIKISERNYIESKIEEAKRYNIPAQVEYWENELKRKNLENAQHYLYEVEIPEDNGSNYIDYFAKMRDQQGILDKVDDYMTNNEVYGFRWERQNPDERIQFRAGSRLITLTPNQSGADLYEEFKDAFGAKPASEILQAMGITGIKVPVNAMRGGNENGDMNYVIFDENDLKIIDKIKFFRTSNGEAYGFTLNGKIYIDPRVATSETPIHEYAHLWTQALRQANPEAWEKLKDEMRNEQDVMDYVKRLYPEIIDEEELMEEVFTHYSGKRGAERLRQEMQAEMEKADTLLDKARVVDIFERIRKALRDFWNMARDLFEGKSEMVANMKAEDFADMMMSDLMSGFKPDADASGTVAGARYHFIGEQGAAEADRAEGASSEDRLHRQPTFYSNAERAVEGIKQEKATPEQWLAMIQKAGGLKAGEDKWMGLSAWLEEQAKAKHSPTKKEVLDFIRSNEIEVEEVNYGVSQSEEWQILDAFNEEFYELQDEAYNNNPDIDVDEQIRYAWDKMCERYGARGLHGFNNAFRVDDNGRLEIDNIEEAIKVANEKKGMNISNPINSTRLDYTTEGLENKREIALVVPSIESWNEGDEVHFGDAGNGRAIAWIRFGETTDADGKRVLVIDEIQSKRHQEGREKGYKNTLDIQKRKEEALKRWDAKASERDAYFDELCDKYGVDSITEIAKNATEEEYDKYRRLINESKEEERKYEELRYEDNYGTGIPDAPFDKNWHELAMKRMLRYAAENGYDKIAWTKGAQQAERYNIGYIVDHILSTETASEGEKAVDVLLKSGMTLKLLVNSNGTITSSRGIDANGKSLADVVGKELALKILNGEGRDATLWDGNRDIPAKSLEGNDLRIGGEGMKGFYDQMLPRFMDKYGKKWGVKTGTVHLSGVGNTTNGTDMWAVDVTPEMKESVMEGQPMFRMREEPKTFEFDADEAERRYNKLNDKYHGKPVQFIRLDNVGDEDFFRAIGATEEDIAEMSVEEMHEQAEKLKKLFKSRHSIGGYSRLNRKITIFADRIEPNQAEEVFFHENIHGILHDWYEEEPRGIAEHFFDAAPKDGGFKDWAFIEKGYEGKELKQKKEEFFVYWLSKAMVEGRTQEILDMLDWEDSERIENILKSIGYERGREESERRKGEEDSGDSEETHGQFLPSLSGGRRNGQSSIGYDRRAEEVQDEAQRNLGQNVSGQLLERDGQPVLSHEESLASSRAAGYTKKQHEAYWKRTQRNMRFAADYAIRKLGLGGRVSVLETPEGLKGRKAKAKGWYDAATGKIVVILSNHGSTSDVIKTVLHEGVAHFGLRKLFGSHFNQFLDNVYQYADLSVRSDIVELAKKHNWDFHTATEEYLARLAEDTNFEKAYKQGWWTKIKSMFLNMLHSIGLADYGGAVLTDNELRYILWRSYENLAEPGMYRNPFRVAEDVVMQSNLGIGNYEKSISRIFSSGGLDMSRQAAENMVAERDGKIHFRDGDFSERDRATARDEYERMVSSGTYQFREAVQDSMLGLEKLYKAILGKDYEHIENVEGYENAYLAENRMSSVNAAEQHDYYVNFMQPLLEAIGAIAGSKKGARQALTDYMMAKHGLERNLVFAERDAREVEANGGDFNDAYNKFRENDYSGLTALTGEKDLATAEAAAQQIVDDYEAAYDTSDLWNRTREATQATLEKIYRSGLLSREQYEKIRDMFQYYIPLQGWDETTSDEVYGYLTSRSGIGGSPIKHAVGRSSKADDPIATIGMMADSAIRQGNRNQMKQRFLNFVLNHPSDLVSVHDLWLEYDAAADEWKPVFADIEDGDTAADVERKVEAFEQRMAQLAEAEPDRYKRGSDAKNIPYKVVKGNLKEHQVLVKRGGQTYVLTINGNPRAAQALNGLTNPDVETSGVVGNILKLGEYVNRKLSTLYTTRNPGFMISNLFRDMLYSNCMTWVKESPRYALRFHKNFGRMNYVKIRILLGKWEKGTLNQSDYTERMFYQFMMNGGETGFTSIRDIEEHKKEIAKELKKQDSTVRKAWAALGMQLDLLNKMVENCARFAAFVTSREMGRSIDRSIYDAKEVSVNFNKKGSGGKMLNAKGQDRNILKLLINPKTYLSEKDRAELLAQSGSYIGGGGRLMWVFWNAGVQGMTNFGRAGKRHGGKAFAGASAMFILGYVIPQLAAAMGGGDGDDDDKNAYYNLPEYVRRSNICFRVGERWITIPLPIEFRGIYGLGELASGAISGNEYYDAKEWVYQIASQVSQILPLDMLEGGGGISPWIPSSVKPFAEAYVMNKGWTGLPIYKDTPWNQNDPEWTKAYKNADQTLVGASKWLNEATGGDDFKKGAIDINPAKLEYLLNGIFGGYADTAEKLKKMGETAFGDREFDWRNMLIANRVIKSGDERTANRKLQNEYFKYKKEYEDTKRLLNKYESAADEGILGMAEKYDFLYNSPEYMRYELFDEYKSDIDDYREEIQEASDDAERKEIEADMYATMRELIDQLHEIK